MRLAARAIVILGLVTAAAAPASADTTGYCTATVEYNLPVAGHDRREMLCGQATAALCEHVGSTTGFPAAYVEVCAKIG